MCKYIAIPINQICSWCISSGKIWTLIADTEYRNPLTPNMFTFTEHSPFFRKIPKLFRQTPIRIAFKATKALFNKLNTRTQTQDIYTNNGVYKLTCQFARTIHWSDRVSLKFIFSKHNRYIWTNNHKSAYALHILNNRHEYGSNPIDKPTVTHSSTQFPKILQTGMTQHMGQARMLTLIYEYIISRYRRHNERMFTFTGQDSVRIRNKYSL